jgi:hypothetical protein
MLLVRISDSGCTPHHSEHSFESLLKRKYNPDIWISPAKWPRLRYARGKCIFFQDYLDKCKKIKKQDEWNTGNAEKKLQLVMDSAHEKRDEEKQLLYVNYLNAQGFDGLTYVTPAAMAFHVNKGLYDRVGSIKESVYMMDYPGQELVTKIIAKNPSK